METKTYSESDLIYSDSFEKNENKYGCVGDVEYCLLCHKPMKIDNNTKYIFYDSDRNIVKEESSIEGFPIGNTCYKRNKKFIR